MCILCSVQKWSRRVATMLPWLVIPLIGLWVLSQFFPPGFRFEVTSPRLACVLVLLVTLFWYEILMPQLSAWRARRSARLRQIKRFEAIELQKLKKMATKRCRNCLTPYKDQNPAAGKFMCSYCGHISKRPVLDISGSAGSGVTSSGVMGELLDKNGKIWNGNVWSENGWSCGHHWLERGNLLPKSLTRRSNYYRRNGVWAFGKDDHCLAEQPCSGVVAFTCRVFEAVFLLIRWLWRRVFGVHSSNDGLSDEEGKDMYKGENGVNFHESKVEKARRKAEEKRQARLERELLEEEERKQREEVARLVEEQRKLRDEKLEAEREHFKGLGINRENDKKKEAERKRQDRRKEKDRGSSKSNSDCEEVEKRVWKESEKKLELDRIATERDLQKTVKERVRSHSSDVLHVSKVGLAHDFSGGTSTRYLDRVKGSFLSSSKAFKGASFFGKGPRTSARVVPEVSKPVGLLDNIHASPPKREVALEIKPLTVPRKSWKQLFTRSSVVSPLLNANVTGTPNQKAHAEAESVHLPDQSSSTLLSDRFNYGLPLSFNPFPSGSKNICAISSLAAGPIFPLIVEPVHDFIPEEHEIFEDPCYVPDPMSLLGPVSESLDHFPSDLHNGILKDTVLERPNALKNISSSLEVKRPSPIEAPNSRSRINEERHSNGSLQPGNTKNQNANSSKPNESSNAHEQGTWQMWDTTPLGQDGINLVGGAASWLLPIGPSKSNQKAASHDSPNKAMTSEYGDGHQFTLSTVSPQKIHLDNGQNQGTIIGPDLDGSGSWLQKSVLSGDGSRKDISLNGVTDGSLGGSAADNTFDASPPIYWSNVDSTVNDSEEGIGKLVLARPPVGGLFSTPDVKSLWSFN